MSLTKRLRTVLACTLLEIGALAGVPMRPDEIQELMHQMNQPTLAHVLPSEEDAGDDPPVAASARQNVSRDT
ncbi:MAG TPA: hypothetical protein VEL79_16410 [Vicinamibacterales bacterium]|nr:hypothetical protein [Vicinamibacterales bacterium]